MTLRRSERLTLVALSILVVLTLAGRSSRTPILLPILLLLAVFTVGLAWLGPRSRAWGLVRDFFPALLVVTVFSVLEPIIAGVNPARWDATFAAVDARYFAAVVEGWRGFLGRPDPFTDFVYAVYFSYYVFPLVIGAAVHLTRGHPDYESTTFHILLAFYLSYLGYFLFPTSGPRLPDSAAALLGGGVVSDAIRAFLRVAEGNHLDAFPSGHTAVSLVTLAVGWRLLPRWRPWLAAWAATIVFATVYIHVHYVIDVICGAGVALGVLLLEAPAVRRLERRAEPGSLAAP